MADYKEAGVDIEAGDNASKIAYSFAKSTFASRKGMMAEPVVDDGSFAGLIDMGDFYLVQEDDGSQIEWLADKVSSLRIFSEHK